MSPAPTPLLPEDRPTVEWMPHTQSAPPSPPTPSAQVFAHLITGFPDSGGLGPWGQTAASLSLSGLQGPPQSGHPPAPSDPTPWPSQAGLTPASGAGGHSSSITLMMSQGALGRCPWSLSLAAWARFWNLPEPPSRVMHLGRGLGKGSHIKLQGQRAVSGGEKAPLFDP